MIKILIFTFLYLILNASAFSKNTTIKNLESCLKNQSELITDETKKEICIQKHSSNIPIDIIKIIRAELSFNNDALFLHVEFKNISTDYIITDLNIDFHHEIDYGSQKGVLHLQQSYNKNLGWSGFWVEPLQTDNISMDIYGYPWKSMDTHGYPWIVQGYPAGQILAGWPVDASLYAELQACQKDSNLLVACPWMQQPSCQ